MSQTKQGQSPLQPTRRKTAISRLFSSLKSRLIVSALVLILVLLPLIGITLNDAFKLQVKTAANNELRAYLYSVLAVTEVDNGKIFMPEQLAENQFNVIQSGLYALLTTAPLPNSNKEPAINNTSSLKSPKKNPETTKQKSVSQPNLAWQSNSFLGLEISGALPQPQLGQSTLGQVFIDGKPHLVFSYSVSFDNSADPHSVPGQSSGFPVTVHIIKDRADYQQQLDGFSNQLWSWLLILMTFLLFVQLAWLMWTLKPLAKFKQELSLVEQGKVMSLSVDYPSELQAVAHQLNALLATEQNQRKRYRNALSDLAHSLKTPLAVILSQKGLSPSSSEQIVIINRIIGHQLKRAQSAAGSSWHLGITVAHVTDKLIRTLGKIYREPQIEFRTFIDNEAIFRGDEADLTEILGNVLDNACKAANATVMLSVTVDNLHLYITVEDDGQGIAPEQEAHIFERGIRADSYQHGHGIGLAIVRDLVDSYHGELKVTKSAALGGAKFTIIF